MKESVISFEKLFQVKKTVLNTMVFSRHLKSSMGGGGGACEVLLQ